MSDARNADILIRALRGESLSALGKEYGITREYARQIVARAGAAEAAREARRAATEARRSAAARPDKLAQRYGISREEHRRLTAAGITRRWRELRSNCAKRAIPFALSLADYARFAEKFKLGRETGAFVLSPRKRELGYVLGNIVVRTVTANVRATRARDTEVPRLAVSPGVNLLYPGTAHPFVAQIGKRCVGHFATAEEAIAARDAAIAQKAAA